MNLAIVVAADANDGIGRNDDIPWRLPADLARFARITRGGVCIVGGRTQRSILARLGRPLPGRQSVVITRRSGVAHEDVHYVCSPTEALTVAAEIAGSRETFIIGGSQVYAALLPVTDTVYLTRVEGVHECDRFMPAGWLDGFTPVHSDTSDDGCTYLNFERTAR